MGMDKVRAKRIATELHGRTVGGWLVGEYLGNGASAVVVSAERSGQAAALKLVDPEMVERYGAPQQLARIERERGLAGHTERNLVKIFDGGQCKDTGCLFVAMELLTLPALTTLIPHFPRGRIGPLIEQLAGAARFLETRGLAHRDIKPDNVVISRDCEQAVLLDLGVVRPIRPVDSDDAGSGDLFLGTTRYSPPEYLMREEDDSEAGWRAVTFYQLGAIVHDAIMRRRLFYEIDTPPARLIEAVRHVRPVIEAADVAPHLVSLARNCLQKDWRLRLELVRWEHFTDSPPPIKSREAKERIRSRIDAGMAESSVALPSARSRSRLLENLGGAVANTVREICLQSGNFPPVEVQHRVHESERLIALTTGPSPRHALDSELHIWIAASTLDDDGLVVRLRGVAAIGKDPADVPLDRGTLIYAGDASAPVQRERLDDFLHLALDAAQNAGKADANLLLPLPSLE
jgi:serine/threonine protein kinase